MHLICQTIAGSQLHGTARPDSDTDRKAVFLPEVRDLVLGRVNHAFKNKETNTEFFSLQQFLTLAAEGQNIAIELLHTPDRFIEKTSDTWEELRSLRHKFHTKNMSTFVGYANRMVTKYVTRGNRLASVRQAIAALEKYTGKDLRLGQVWNTLPDTPHTYRGVSADLAGVDKRAYFVCGRVLPATITVVEARSVLTKIRDNFGQRVQEVADGDGNEQKSFAHAWRAAFQFKHLLVTGNIPFPLPEAPFLYEVKTGLKANYKELGEQLDQFLTELSTQNAQSALPDSVDPLFIEQLVLKAYRLS